MSIAVCSSLEAVITGAVAAVTLILAVWVGFWIGNATK